MLLLLHQIAKTFQNQLAWEVEGYVPGDVVEFAYDVVDLKIKTRYIGFFNIAGKFVPACKLEVAPCGCGGEHVV